MNGAAGEPRWLQPPAAAEPADGTDGPAGHGSPAAPLESFEHNYQMSSEECQRKCEAGELGDAVEFFEWTSLYTIYQSNEQARRLLQEKLS